MIQKIGWGFGRCNQFCKHCYNASSWKAPAHDFAVLKTIADKICPHITDINYGTGEFIVNPNALGLARYIHDVYPHISQSVTSNGSTVMAMREFDIKTLFHDIDISLDFPDAAKYNDFRGNPDAWLWSLGALRKLQNIGVPRTLVTCVTSMTSDDDIKRLLDIALGHGAFWRINWFRRAGRGGHALRITAERAWDIMKMLSERVEFLVMDSIFGAVWDIPSKPCSAGHSTCRIHEGLTVSPYPFLKGQKWDGGNIADNGVDLQTVYESKPFFMLRQRKPGLCADCPLFAVCRGGCATRAILHSGIDKPDDYCPMQAGLDITALQEYKPKIAQQYDLVHNGYLCTAIVKPV